MATLLVPYNTAMQLGSGFNSFTQTLCIDHAVVPDTSPLVEENTGEEGKKHVAQSVIYKMSAIKKATDVTDEMNINGAFNIKYGDLKVDGNGSFISTDKIKDSDFSIMVSVKVVNQAIYDHSLTKFQPITSVKDASSERLVEVYGDSYISGWQEGGEFLAVMSIKAKNRDEAQNIAADAKIAYTQNKDTASENGKKDFDLKVDAAFKKLKNSIATENEISVSVTWVGGGQNLKPAEKDWDFDTMKDVALKFPDLCAKTPMRTHALLTKYTALRSFYTTQTFSLPVYDKTATYTNVLQEAFLDYKSILGAIQVLAFDVSEGKKVLIVNPRSGGAVEQAQGSTEDAGKKEPAKQAGELSPGTDIESTEGIVVDVASTVTKEPAKVITLPPPVIEAAFPPTIAGLEDARQRCRFMMNRIVQEIDNITIKPEIATDENRQTPYLSPFLFKLLLPLGMDLPAESSEIAQNVAAAKANPEALSNRFLSLAT